MKKLKNPSNLKKHLGYIAIILIFSFLIFSLLQKTIFDRQLQETKLEMFPSLKEGGFTLGTGYKAIDIDNNENASAIHLRLKPGDIFQGQLFLKNHDLNAHTFTLITDPFYKVGDSKESNQNPIKENMISFIPKENRIFVSAEDVVFTEYQIKTSPELEEGVYESVVSAKNEDKKGQQLISESGVVFDLAVGTRIKLEIGKTITPYNYEIFSEKVKDFAIKRIVTNIRYFLTFVLILTTIYLGYKGFKSKN